MTHVTRRRFLAQSAAFSCASGLLVPAVAAGAANETTGSDREPLQLLDYNEVKLTGGPLGEHYVAVHAHYLSLSNDRLLKVYRQRAGLPAPGADMGGWYDLDGFVPGHSLGQYISGLARLGRSTGDSACHEKVYSLVEGFGATLGPKNESILRPETNLWICYTLDKHFAGLIDAASLSNVSEAIPLLTRVLDGAQPLLPAVVRDRIGKKNPPYDESFVMPENLFTAADLTGNPEFAALAQRYMLDKDLFNPLSRGEDPFPGQHAYSHAIALSSAGMAYIKHGDPKYRDALQHAFFLLTTQQQFASGGWGPNETFIHPHRGELYSALSTTQDHFETPCGSYAATKLARYLLRTTPQKESADTRYGDNLERVLFNTILAAKPPDSDGDYPYYSTYSSAAEKVFYPKKWPCCSGTLVQTVADYPLNCYFAGDTASTLTVNLYTPSEARFDCAGVPLVLRQETDFPSSDTTVFKLQTPHDIRMTLSFRIPAWCAGRARLEINGKLHTEPAAGTWCRVSRRWSSGDRVLLTLPQEFRFEAIDDQHPDVVAVMRGPVQYVALNAPEGMPHVPAPANLRAVAPELYVESTTSGTLTFVPLYRVANESYTSYFVRT